VAGGQALRRACVGLLAIVVALPAGAHAAAPKPGSPEYVQRDNQNMSDAYGRETAPDGQFNNPNYTLAIRQEHNDVWFQQLAQQAATPGHLALTPGNVFPGWNGGNPFRRGWNGKRGQISSIAYTNRYGALIRGDVFAPLPGAKDPYTGEELKPPYPGVVITTGSIQGSERMYWWLAQDLAERGYVVLTYDVQGQGTSETLPHENDQVNAFPFCNPFAPPGDKEELGCPGVPFQQESNFIFGTQDALSFFLSSPGSPYANPHAGSSQVNAFNPYWQLFDRSPDKRSATPGRTTRMAIVGHSLGAAAISYVQGVDKRVEAAVAFDKLSASGSGGVPQGEKVKPVVPALAVQSEYGFNVQPYTVSHGSSFAPQPGPPDQGPDPIRERKTGFEPWRKAGVDSMLIVPRASTHLEYTDIAYVLPASRYGQDVSSVYTQRWLDRYLKHRNAPLLSSSLRYIEPVDVGKWQAVNLQRSKQLSFYFCSAYSMHDARTGRRIADGDIARVGGCPALASEAAGGRGCLARRAPIGPRNIGRVRLGLTRRQLLGRVPAPRRKKGRSWRWCVKGGKGTVSAAFTRKGRVALVATTAPRHGNRRVHPGTRITALRHAYPRARAVGRALLRANPGSPRLLGVRRGRVRYVAVSSRRIIARPGTLRSYLRRAGVAR
jgi:dienelactone hydrolase